MYLAGRWYAVDLSAPAPKTTPRASGLDVALLQRHVLEQLLGIGDIRTDKRIDFVGGARGTAGLERRRRLRRGRCRVLDVSGDDRRSDGDLGCRRDHAAQVDLVRTEIEGWVAGPSDLAHKAPHAEGARSPQSFYAFLNCGPRANSAVKSSWIRDGRAAEPQKPTMKVLVADNFEKSGLDGLQRRRAATSSTSRTPRTTR